MVEEYPAYTLNQINVDLRRQLPNKPQISVSTLHRCLDAQLITVKKMENAPAERNRADVKEARKVDAECMLADEDIRELIFVDESGYNLWLSRTRGRAPRGQRCVRVVGGRTGPNFTLVIAVSNARGLLYSTTVEGGVNSERFNSFLDNASNAAGPRPATFLFDNAPSHRRAREARFREHHTSKHLPAYSPFLNLAGNAFSVWKAAVKRNLEEVHDQMLQQDHQHRLATMAQVSEQNL